MLDINMIEEEINKLENSKYTSYITCQKLATLYVVRDHYPYPPVEEGPIEEEQLPINIPISPMMPQLK